MNSRKQIVSSDGKSCRDVRPSQRASALPVRNPRFAVLLKYLIVFVCLIVGYLLVAFGTNLLPQKPIVRHAQKTLAKGDLQNDFWFTFTCTPAHYIDNFTDALILNQTVSGGSDDLVTSAMLLPRAEGYGEQCAALRALLDGEDLPLEFYPRYWHGSTFLMRVLLQFGDYRDLRLLFYALSSLLLLWMLWALGRKVGVWASALCLLALTFVNFFIMQFSIQFLPVLMLAVAGALWVLYRVRRPAQLCMTLFVVGSLTSFFDLLTCPLLTWGIPIFVYLLMRRNMVETMWQKLWQIVRSALLWAVGYGGTWVSKWLLASALTSYPVVHDAIRQSGVRAAGGDDFSRWDACLRNMDLITWKYVALVVIVLAVLAVLAFNRKGLKTALPCLVVALAPWVWYAVLANHSYLHYWFTYRLLALTLMGLFFAMASLVDWKKVSGLTRFLQKSDESGAFGKSGKTGAPGTSGPPGISGKSGISGESAPSAIPAPSVTVHSTR